MSVPASAAPAASPSLSALLNESVWRAGHMGRARSLVTSTGHAMLDHALPDSGWPHRGLIELLVQQPGIGEMRLLQPALQALGNRRIALLQPPYLPQVAAWRAWGLAPEQLLWVRAPRHADALWSAEQVLRNGSCGALLLWQGAVRNEWLRRLQLAAQSSDMLCWLLRPLAAADTPSPAPLRIALHPLAHGLRLDIRKRRGPQCTTPLELHWPRQAGFVDEPFSGPDEANDALLDRRYPAAAATASAASALV